MEAESSNALVNISLVALFLTLFVLAFSSRIRRIKMQRERDKAQKEYDALRTKYGPIMDVEAEVQNRLNAAAKIRQESEVFAKRTESIRSGILENARIQAEKNTKSVLEDAYAQKHKAEERARQIETTRRDIIQQAKDKASVLLQKARAEAEEVEASRDSIIQRAKEQADLLVSNARVEAERIAGDALEAKEKADTYKSAIRAMRNQIEGYSDDYIIPNHSVLDDLADEFSHKDAGEQLRESRARVKMLIKEAQAATCDYAEANRRTTAILFVLDAFNGKVDTALSKVKHDNYGKLEQEIRDAFALVNRHGEAFRQARIQSVYLNTRLEELRWAVAVQELKLLEREEQRAIREQIREEEKARREMEKAIKDAEKEEKLLAKALKEAKAQLASAHDDQKAEYETKLAQLQDQLTAAEERGQRAISMAEQTRRGHVYVISNIGSFGEHVYKIGMTRRLEPLDRVKELGDASVPFEFDVHAMIFSEDAPALEKELHRHFLQESVNKVNPRKEFFGVSLPLIRQVVEQLGLNDIHWTMKAEAAEYRESLAIGRGKEMVVA